MEVDTLSLLALHPCTLRLSSYDASATLQVGATQKYVLMHLDSKEPGLAEQTGLEQIELVIQSIVAKIGRAHV